MKTIVARIDRSALPGTVFPETSGFYTCWPLGRETAPRVRVIVHDSGAGVLVLHGTPEHVDAIASKADATWPDLAALRADTRATDVIEAWPDERPIDRKIDGSGTGARIGERVALRASMAGYVDLARETEAAEPVPEPVKR